MTSIVGELVGARLIAHAGTLLDLAKRPSSEIQMFRAKNKRMISQTQLVSQAEKRLRLKIERLVANEASKAARIDAIDPTKTNFGVERRAILESKIHILEQNLDKKRKKEEEKAAKKAAEDEKSS